MKRFLFLTLLLSTSMQIDAEVALHAATQSFEIGTDSFLYCFYSTISANLEPAGWGSRFPILMKKLSAGSVAQGDVPALREEIVAVRAELKKFPPSSVVWDFKHRDRQPPWGANISTSITDLSNYFVTSDGKDLFQIFLQAIAEAERKKTSIDVE